MLRGEPIWQTSSTGPMSMPSSSEAVATSAAQLARAQPLLGREPAVLGQAAVVGGDLALAEPLAEQVRDPLGQPPGVDEDERRAVRPHVRGDPVEDLAPLLVRRDGLQLAVAAARS